jgi:hypothetical protein
VNLPLSCRIQRSNRPHWLLNRCQIVLHRLHLSLLRNHLLLQSTRRRNNPRWLKRTMPCVSLGGEYQLQMSNQLLSLPLHLSRLHRRRRLATLPCTRATDLDLSNQPNQTLSPCLPKRLRPPRSIRAFLRTVRYHLRRHRHPWQKMLLSLYFRSLPVDPRLVMRQGYLLASVRKSLPMLRPMRFHFPSLRTQLLSLLLFLWLRSHQLRLRLLRSLLSLAHPRRNLRSRRLVKPL